MARIFISYRTADTGDYARRLGEHLGRFDYEAVVLDQKSIDVGRNFADRIRQELVRSQAALILIGPNWVGTSPDGTREIDAEDDWVRREVMHLLDATIPVTPVLFGSAEIPKRENLPPPIRELAARQGYQFNVAYFDRDASDLCTRIERSLAQADRDAARDRPSAPNPLEGFRRQLAIIIAFLFVVTFGVAIAQAQVSELPPGLWAFPAFMDFAAFAWWLYAGTVGGSGKRRFI